MKSVLKHIEHIKGKPHHIRKRVAFGTAAVGTAAVALVWLVGSLSSGVFALKDSSFADQSSAGALTASGSNDSQNLAGAAAANLAGAVVPAHIEIIDVASSTRAEKKAEPTTIPF